MISSRDRATATYLSHDSARICDECATLTSTKAAGYSTLILKTGHTRHFCSGACLSANVNTPGLPDAYRQLKIFCITLIITVAALVTYIVIR